MFLSDTNKTCSGVLSRIDCHPEPGATKQKCKAKGCCWKKDKGPWCFKPIGNLNIKPKFFNMLQNIVTNKNT